MSTSIHPDITSQIQHLAFTSLQETDDLIQKVGPRLAGSPSCHSAAQVLHTKMQDFCDESRIEGFPMHPTAFLGFTKALPVLYILAFLSWRFFSLPILIPVCFLFVGVALAILQFVVYAHTFDKFYPQKEGYNVSGIINPSGPILQQICLVAHHDSAYEFSFLQNHPKWYALRIFCGSGFYLVTFLAYVFLLIFNILCLFGIFKFSLGTWFHPTFLGFQLIGTLLILPFYWFRSNRGTPGAGDNLIASFIALNIGQYLAHQRSIGSPLLTHTRVILLSTDGEEAGLLGARAFLKKHPSLLRSLPTSVINLDSIYSQDELHFLTSDINGTVPLSASMATQLQDVSRSLGYQGTKIGIPLGGGGTDAAEFARVGIAASSIVAMSLDANRDHLVYHTSSDTVDHIELDAVEAVLHIILHYLQDQDHHVRTPS